MEPMTCTGPGTEKNAVATPSPSEVKPQGSISQMAKSFESPPVSQPEKGKREGLCSQTFSLSLFHQQEHSMCSHEHCAFS